MQFARPPWKLTGAVLATTVAIVAGAALSQPQSENMVPPYSGAVPADVLVKQPVTSIYPGGVPVRPDIRNPLAHDPDAARRGMQDFNEFNCSGCHAANGAGGMGPSLSNDIWIYKSSPANIYLSILQGRPNGMPAWGTMLPDRTIWELVSYIKSISQPPQGFGVTTSRNPQQPAIEQVPAEQITTTQPWSYTEPFENGQKPPG